MRGVYHAVTALLVTASSHIAAESNRSDPVQTPSNGLVASSDAVDEVLPYQESRGPQHDLALNEERAPSALQNSLEELEQIAVITLNAMNTNTANVIAKAEKTFEDHKKLMPVVEAEIRKRKRMDPSPSNVNGQALHALPNPEEYLVSGASNLPSTSSKRLDRGEPTVMMANAARSRTHHDLRLALSSPPTSSVASADVQLDKNALDLDMTKHKGEVEFQNSKHQRIGPMPYVVHKEKVFAFPDLDKALVWVASDAPLVLQKRLRTPHVTVIISNAANYIIRHDFRPALSGSVTTSAAAPVDRHINQLMNPKALEFGMKKHFDEVNSHLVGHHLHLREGNDKFAHPTTVNGQSVPKDRTGQVNPRSREYILPVDKIYKIHKAFLEAFNLPFHQYPLETAKMIKTAERFYESSPSNHHSIDAFATLATLQTHEELKRLLGPDVEKLLRNEKLVLPGDLKNLQEAYYAKLIIMYELFYEFSHNHKNLFDDLPDKARRPSWILKLSPSISGSGKHPSTKKP